MCLQRDQPAEEEDARRAADPHRDGEACQPTEHAAAAEERLQGRTVGGLEPAALEARAHGCKRPHHSRRLRHHRPRRLQCALDEGTRPVDSRQRAADAGGDGSELSPGEVHHLGRTPAVAQCGRVDAVCSKRGVATRARGAIEVGGGDCIQAAAAERVGHGRVPRAGAELDTECRLHRALRRDRGLPEAVSHNVAHVEAAAVARAVAVPVEEDGGTGHLAGGAELTWLGFRVRMRVRLRLRLRLRARNSPFHGAAQRSSPTRRFGSAVAFRTEPKSKRPARTRTRKVHASSSSTEHSE
eukprot:scaffold96135_cov57-Phaeocystis_antarctica.AAC.2